MTPRPLRTTPPRQAGDGRSTRRRCAPHQRSSPMHIPEANSPSSTLWDELLDVVAAGRRNPRSSRTSCARSAISEPSISRSPAPSTCRCAIASRTIETTSTPASTRRRASARRWWTALWIAHCPALGAQSQRVPALLADTPRHERHVELHEAWRDRARRLEGTSARLSEPRCGCGMRRSRRRFTSRPDTSLRDVPAREPSRRTSSTPSFRQSEARRS